MLVASRIALARAVSPSRSASAALRMLCHIVTLPSVRVDQNSTLWLFNSPYIEEEIEWINSRKKSDRYMPVRKQWKSRLLGQHLMHNCTRSSNYLADRCTVAEWRADSKRPTDQWCTWGARASVCHYWRSRLGVRNGSTVWVTSATTHIFRNFISLSKK